jgi:CheY-like chemotaxis protein
MNSSLDRPAPSVPSVLLVDDVVHGMIARKTVLIGMGCSVEMARSGELAMELISAGHTFDIMVTDYRMPGGMDGVELIRRVREQCPRTKIVMLSGLAETLGMTEETTGADVLLSKSGGEAGQLLRTVRNLLARRTARKPAASEKMQKQNPAFMVKSS